MADYNPALDDDELAGLIDQNDMANAVPPELAQEQGVPPEVLSQAPPVAPPVNSVSDAVLQSILARSGQSDQAIADARASRNDQVQNANLLQSIGALGNALGSQGRMKQDTAPFDAVREQADLRAKEAISDADRNRKMVSDAIRQNYLESFRQGQIGRAQKREDRADQAQKNLEEHRRFMEAQAKEAAKARDERLKATYARTAHQLTEAPEIRREVIKGNAASGAEKLIDEIESGGLTDSKNVRTQLTNLLASVEMGGPGAHADRAAMGVDTLYGKLADLASYATGHPQSSIPDKFVQQLRAEVEALGSRAGENYKRLTESALSGADFSALDPDADPGMIAKLIKQKQQTFLNQIGADPKTGIRISGQNKQALKWVKDHPDDPRNAAILKKLGM